MRVLIFSTAYFPHVGGAEVAVKEITDRLISGSTSPARAVEPLSFDMITVRLSKKDLPQEKLGILMYIELVLD